MIRPMMLSLVTVITLINPAAVPFTEALAGDVGSGPLTDQQVGQLFDWMASQSDIAFQYKQDGCYARAHLMIRRMQSRGMSPGKVWAFAPPGDSLFVGTPYSDMGVVQWQYHVAPFVQVRNNGGLFDVVIDPSMFPGPVRIDIWRKDMKSRSNKVWLATTRIGEPPTLPGGTKAMGSGYWPGPDPSPDLDSYSLEMMRQFSTSNGVLNSGNNGNSFGNNGGGFGNNGNGFGINGGSFGNNGTGLNGNGSEPCSNCGNYPCTCANSGMLSPTPLRVTKRIENPPLPPATIDFANSHSQELVVQIIDKRHPNERPVELSIRPGDSRTHQVDRDPGSAVVRLLLDPHSGQPLQELARGAIPPKSLYDVVVFENSVRYTYYDRTLKGPEKYKPQITRNSLRSIGVFTLPAGERLNDGQCINVYRDAAHQNNPGAAARYARPIGTP